MTRMPYKLPEVDENGTYWLGIRGEPPAIFPARQREKHGKFHLLVGKAEFFMQDGDLFYFDSPVHALKMLNLLETGSEKERKGILKKHF